MERDPEEQRIEFATETQKAARIDDEKVEI
jgi:hypothetical protein